MNRFSFFPILALAAAGLAWGQEATPTHLVMKAKIRDFREFNTVDTVGMHPHFNTKGPCSVQKFGSPSVAPDISLSDAADGGLYEGDNRGPRLVDPLPTEIRGCFEPLERFSDWFQDKGPDTNRSFRTELRFTHDPATGLYRFSDSSFFPIDDGGSFSKFKSADPAPFGHLQRGTKDNIDLSTHNYGFTMELHTNFQYHKGKNQAFYFEGDDDVWVYMNGKLVVDLGGIHTTEGDTVYLDSLGLDSGKVYPLDLFFAERLTSSSTCTITTSLVLQNSIPSVATPLASPAGSDLPLPRKIALSSITPDAEIYYTTDGSVPDSSSTPYTDSITVEKGVTISAIAYKSGWHSSEVMKETFSDGTVSLRKPAFAARKAGRPGEILLLNASAGARVALHDRQGRLIRILSAGPAPASGIHSLIWNGEDASGRAVAPGLYFWKSLSGDASPAGSGKVLSPH